MIAQKNITTILVGKNLDLLAAASKREDLAVGQIGVFTAKDSAIDELTPLGAGDKFQIATRNAKGSLVVTPVISYDDVAKKSAQAYVAPTQQVTYIGYNGTDGAIDVKNDTNYVMHIFVTDDTKTGSTGVVFFAAYYSSSAATQQEIAEGLVANLNANINRMGTKLISAETADNGAGVYGVKLTALSQDGSFEVGLKSVSPVSFTAELQGGFGSTPVTTTAKSSAGTGTYSAVAYHEWFLIGNSGEPWRQGNYPKQVQLVAEPGATYEQIVLDYTDKNATTVDREVSSFGSVYIPVVTGAAVIAKLKTILGIA